MKAKEFNVLKLYTLYTFTAVLNFWIILFNLGFSAGLANYFPLFALFGTVLLFIVASPILMYKIRIGLIIGLVNLLFILPFSLLYTISLFRDWSFSWNLLLITIPFFLVVSCTYITGEKLFSKEQFKPVKNVSLNTKLILMIIPPLLFILYVVCYGKNWNFSNMFNIHKF